MLLATLLTAASVGCAHSESPPPEVPIPETAQHECQLAEGHLVLRFEVPEGHALATSPEAWLLPAEIDDSYALIVPPLRTDLL